MDSAPRLTVELVPQSQWGANLAESLKGPRWDLLRKATYRRANHRCEICGGVGAPVALHAHEVWEYDEAAGIQRLVRLIALCPACHEVKHIGLAGVKGRGAQAAAHLAEVNGWSKAETEAQIASAFVAWRRRNKVKWTLDLSILSEYGVEPPSAKEIAAVRWKG